MTKQDPSAAALQILTSRFPEAGVMFLSGSVTRGEATETSDLDLVVVYEHVEHARRESFLHGGWPVEAFVHDPETLRYFFLEIDRPAGVPSLADMVAHAIALPIPNDFSRSLQALAEHVIAVGPPQWGESELAASRYAITNLVDDLRSPRSRDELTATATKLYSGVAEHFFRSQNLWSAKGKSIPRRLKQISPAFADRFNDAFRDIFEHGRPQSVIELCESLLAPTGGWLFSGYTVLAPRAWRSSDATESSNDAGQLRRRGP